MQMNIFLVKDGKRQGPCSVDEVALLIRKGECSLSDLAWREGMSDWQPIHSLPDIVEAVLPPLPIKNGERPVQTGPPPIPDQRPDTQPAKPYQIPTTDAQTKQAQTSTNGGISKWKAFWVVWLVSYLLIGIISGGGGFGLAGLLGGLILAGLGFGILSLTSGGSSGRGPFIVGLLRLIFRLK